jgi:leader peptidase (prepilin peptidase) / N-methyltransferase
MTSHLVAAMISAIFGLLYSQLLQVAMRKTPMRQRLRATTTHCSNCGVAVEKNQRIPLLAMPCTTCATPLKRDSPWFEIVVTISLGIVGMIVGLVSELPAYLVFTGSLIALTVVDLRHYLLPNRIVYPTLFACMLLMIVPAFIDGVRHYETALLGMVGSWAFFLVVFLINPRGLGFGDVRLSAVIGFMTGWLAIGNSVLAILLGLFSGAIVGLLLAVVRIRGLKDHIPYGPFLALGAVLAIYGPIIAS